MKTFFKKFFVFVAILTATLFTTNLVAENTFAAGDPLGSCRSFLGMTSWDCGIGEINSTESLKNSAVLIAINVLADLGVIAAYLVLGYTIYGGYLYIFANGDAGKVSGGKKTLTRAFIGLAVVSFANIILNTIRIAFLGNAGAFNQNCATSQCINPVDFVGNAISWFIGIAGVVSVIFVVTGAIGYITSSGDAGKLQKAKNTIIYALIGLAVVGLSQAAVTFVSNMIKEAESTALLEANEIIISKEYNNEK